MLSNNKTKLIMLVQMNWVNKHMQSFLPDKK